MDILLNRRSVRKFSDKEITEEELDYLIKVGFSAPSARAQNSRQFVIIDDKEIIKELSTVSRGAKVLENANKVIAVIGLSDDLLTTPSMKNADLAASTQNILLGATKLNLGSCWIGLHPETERMEKTAKILNLRENQYAFSMIALGNLEEDFKFSYKDKVIKEYVFRNKVE